MTTIIRRNTITQQFINQRNLNRRNALLNNFIGTVQAAVEHRKQSAFVNSGFIHIHALDVNIPSREKIQEFKNSDFLRVRIYRKTFETLNFNNNVSSSSTKTYTNMLKTFDDDFWKGVLIQMNIKSANEITNELIDSFIYNKNFLGKKDKRVGRLNSTVLKRWVLFCRDC